MCGLAVVTAIGLLDCCRTAVEDEGESRKVRVGHESGPPTEIRDEMGMRDTWDVVGIPFIEFNIEMVKTCRL